MALSSPPAFDFYFGTMETTEDMSGYVFGGYHPVVLGDILTDLKNGQRSRDQYRVIAKLGYGTNGTVWLAHKTLSTQEWVAIKVSTAMDENIPQAKEIDMLEAACKRTETQCGPSHIVKLLDHFLLRGPNGVHPVLVTEVVTPLPSLLNRYNYNPLWRKTVAHGLAQGVAHLHDVGIVHGDLHLGNVGVAFPQLADQDPFDVVAHVSDHDITVVLPYSAGDHSNSLPPYVIAPSDLAKYYNKISGSTPPLTEIFDFGTAHEIGTQLPTYQCAVEVDTPEAVFARYVQNIMNPPVEPAADVWALGTTIYEIVSGSSLFDGHTGIPLLREMVTMAGSLPSGQEWQDWHANLARPPKISRKMANAWWASRRKLLRPTCQDKDDTNALITLLQKILVLDPALRPRAEDVLEDPWFKHKEHPALSTGQINVPRTCQATEGADNLVPQIRAALADLTLGSKNRDDMVPRFTFGSFSSDIA